MSSPHHSSRAGAAIPKPYTSRMPPRTLNSATSVTVPTRAVSHPLERRGHVGRGPAARRRRAGAGARSSAAGTSVRSAVARAVVTSDPQPPLQQRLDRLGALAGDLVVRLVLAQRLALRVQRDAPSVRSARSVSQRSASPRRGGHDDDQPLRLARARARRRARAPLDPGSPPSRSVAPRARQPLGQVDRARATRSKASRTGLSFTAAASSRLASAISPRPSSSAAQSSGPRRSASAPRGEGERRRRRPSDARARLSRARRTCASGAGAEQRLARVEVGADRADGVASRDEVVGARRPPAGSTPPPSTGHSRSPCRTSVTRSGSGTRIAGRAVGERPPRRGRAG